MDSLFGRSDEANPLIRDHSLGPEFGWPPSDNASPPKIKLEFWGCRRSRALDEKDPFLYIVHDLGALREKLLVQRSNFGRWPMD
jgi:hypothetical protein